MNTKTERWLYGLGSAVISGGAGAVVSGLTSMGIDPDKFNISSIQGMAHILILMFANFVVSGFLGGMFYLKQSPLPPESTGNSDPVAFVKPQTPNNP